MSDYSAFTSMGGLYDFSKGPKGIYYAKGDENLFGIVLNIPQTDDDDEWGGTERIALERVSDEIGALQEYVLDPAGGGNGLVDRVTALETVVDSTNSTVTVGNITLDGTTDTVTVGASAALLDGNTLQLGGSSAFKIDEIGGNQYDITFKDVALKMFDDGVSPTLTAEIGATSYIFGESSLTVGDLTISGDLTVSGDLGVTNLTMTGDLTGVKDIGTSGTYMESLYVDEVNCSTLCGTIVKTGNISPLYNTVPYDLGLFSIGAPGNRYNVLAARDINLGDTVTATFTVDGTDGSMTSGPQTVTGDIVPSVTATYDLGNPSTPLRWQGIAAVTLNLTGNIVATDLNVNDINMHDLLANDIIAHDVSICGTAITIDGADLDTNANITATGGNIVSDQLTQGSIIRATTYLRADDTTEPSAPTVGYCVIWYEENFGGTSYLKAKNYNNSPTTLATWS